jgi:hypothetical protein
MATPTSRTLQLLRREGYLAETVEKWIPRIERRRDLFGFSDVLAVHPAARLFLLVQVTSLGHVADRLKKVQGRSETALWLRAGGRVEIHGWAQRGDRWTCKRVAVQAADLSAVVVAVRPRRCKSPRQRELFE